MTQREKKSKTNVLEALWNCKKKRYYYEDKCYSNTRGIEKKSSYYEKKAKHSFKLKVTYGLIVRLINYTVLLDLNTFYSYVLKL